MVGSKPPRALAARWHVLEPDPQALARFCTEPILPRGGKPSPLLARLLLNRGLRTPEEARAFLDPSLSRGLRSPLLFQDMGRAVARLIQALEKGEKVFVYGDYDVDGVTGSAQLLLFLRELGASPGLYIPHRVREGYGLNERAVREMAFQGARVLVTVDCGAASHREVALAQNLGIDVIVCDHHHVPEVRPPALALLNPMERGCPFSLSGLSGAGVVFYLLMGLRMGLRQAGKGPLPNLRRYLDLVALGTVADLVPLVEENRTLVAYGLKEIAQTQRLGVQALKEVSGLSGDGEQKISSGHVAFRLGPRLNAGGRLADAKKAVELLTTTDLSKAHALAAELDRENRERQGLEEEVLRQALTQVEEVGDRWSLVLASPDWHPGVIGIVASRLVEAFHRPTILIALDGELGRGSGRSPYSFHLYQGIKACGDLLEGFGGHRQAAGLSIRQECIPEFARRFERVVREALTEEDLIPTVKVDGELPLSELNLALLEELQLLEPHGQGNPEPVFLAREVRVLSSRVVGRDSGPGKGGHLKLFLVPSEGGKPFEAIWFGRGNEEISFRDRLDVLYTPQLHTWNGTARMQLRLRDIKINNV